VVPPAPARQPAPGYAEAPSSGARVKPVSAYPGGADVDVPPGLFAPAPAPPVQQVPTSKPSTVQPAKLEQGYAQPAGPSEPGFDERVYRMPAPGSKASPKPLNETKKPKGRRGAASAPAPAPSAAAAPPATPSAPAAAARGSVPSPAATRAYTPTPAAPPAPAEPTVRVPTSPPPTRSPVADPATTTARPAPAAGPAPSQPTTRRARKQARAAAAAAAKAQAAQAAAATKAQAAEAKAQAAQAAAAAKAQAAEAKVQAAQAAAAAKAQAAQAAAAKASAKVSAKATKATKAAKAAPEPVSPLRAGSIEGEVLSESTQPTSGAPDSRRGRSKDRPLRKGEREHIDWVTQLVQIEHDSVLKTSKER
jgi:hypothetical protein